MRSISHLLSLNAIHSCACEHSVVLAGGVWLAVVHEVILDALQNLMFSGLDIFHLQPIVTKVFDLADLATKDVKVR